MRRGFQPPADLWGSVGDLGGPNVRSTFGKIWVTGDRLLGKFWLGAIECLSLGGGGFI
jgi:hypothetical protein